MPFFVYGTWTCFTKSDTGGRYIPIVMVGEAQVSAEQKGVAGCGIETGDDVRQRLADRYKMDFSTSV